MAGFSLPGQVPYAPVGGPSDFAVASNAALRKRKLAEMLQQQAMKGPEMPTLPGARMSWSQPLAALLNSYVSDKLGKESDAEEAAANKANQEGLAAHIAAMPQNTPGVAAQPIEQEQVGPPPAPDAPPPAPPGLAAAFGPQGMPDVGPRDNELKGSAGPLAALLSGGAPPPAPSPLAPPAPEGPAGPPLLPQKMDMAAPGMLPKLATDAIPGHTVTPQELFQYGAGFNKFGKAGEDIGKQITGSAVKSLMPMSPEATAELAMKHAEFQQTLQQRADAAKMRSEDMRLSVDQRAEAARMHDATMRELAAARREAAAAAGAGEKGNMAVEGASLDGNTVVRNTKTGIAHEVINGVPSPEPYKGPVTPKTDQAKGVAVAAKGSQGLKDMTAALNAVEADPDIYGPRATAGAALPNAFGISRSVGGLTPEQQTTRANISSMTADVTHSLYGSAFSAGEQARAKGFLIDPLDDAKTVKAKLRGRMELEQDHYNNLPASAKAAATARQGGGGAAASGGWGKAEKG